MGLLLFVIALFVAIVAGVTGGHLSDDEDRGGYWPKDPILLAQASVPVDLDSRQIAHFGNAYRITPRQQVDFHFGFGLSHAAPFLCGGILVPH